MRKVKDETIDVWQDSLEALDAAQQAVNLAEQAILKEMADDDIAECKLGEIARQTVYRVDESHLRRTFKAVHGQCTVESVRPVLVAEDKPGNDA